MAFRKSSLNHGFGKSCEGRLLASFQQNMSCSAGRCPEPDPAKVVLAKTAEHQQNMTHFTGQTVVHKQT